jgi:uncharacterized protein YkwD
MLLLLIFFFEKGVIGQNAKSTFTSYNCNEKYLEHLIKEKIDSVRIAHNLLPLANDSILHIAAKYHANWMNENNKFAHEEKTNPTMLTPQMRVNHYGATNYLVGENIIKSYINTPLEDKKGKPYINKTYEDMVNDFVKGWVNSPGHYKNIITKEYDITGVSISINTKKNLIYAVQKFANVPNQYQFQENKDYFTYSNYIPTPPVTSFEGIAQERLVHKYPYKLKATKNNKDSSKKCDVCNTALDLRLYKDFLEPNGRKIKLHSFNIDALEKTIRKRRDGFALEFISYTPYDCGNSEYYTLQSRRNNQSLISDTVIIPIYKKDLKKGFKKATYSKFFHIRKKGTAEYFDLNLGSIPKDLNGYYEVNIIVIQKKRICRILHFSDYCGEDIGKIFKPSNVIYQSQNRYTRKPYEGTINFSIPFERGKFDYNLKDIKKALGALSETEFSVDSITIKAYSSLEGSEEINNSLQIKRAESILFALRNNQENEFKSSIISSPNWELFEKQINKESELKELKGLSKNEIILKLQDKSYTEKIEPFLSAQRIGNVTMKVTFKLPINVLADTLLADFDNTVLYFNKTQSRASYDSLVAIQDKIFQLYFEKNATDKHLSDISARTGKQGELVENNIWHWYSIKKSDSVWVSQKFGPQLNSLYTKNEPSKYMNTLIAVDRIKQFGFYKDQNDATIYADVNNLYYLNDSLIRLKIDSLKLFTITTLLHYYRPDSENFDNNKKQHYCQELLQFIQSHFFTEEEIIKFTKYFLFLQEDGLAFNLINDYIIKNKTLFDETKTLHAKLGYYHHQEYRNNEYAVSLLQLYNSINTKSWCEMFVGPCNISFQVFDYEPLRTFYCEKCEEYKNYGQQPERWIVK